MKTRYWLMLFCTSLAVTIIFSSIYTGMSVRDPGKSPVFTILLICGILWLVSGLALVWRSIPEKRSEGPEQTALSHESQTAREACHDLRISPIHWIGLLVICLTGYPLLLFLGLPQYAGYCLFNGGIAVLGVVASLAGPGFS